MAPIRASKTPPVSPPSPIYLRTPPPSPPPPPSSRGLRLVVARAPTPPVPSSRSSFSLPAALTLFSFRLSRRCCCSCSTLSERASRLYAAALLDGCRGGGVHVARGGRRDGRGARHAGLPRRVRRRRGRRQGRGRRQARQRRPARQVAPAQAPEPATIVDQGPQPVPGLRRRPYTGGCAGGGHAGGTGSGHRDHDVPQRVHDREGEDGAGAVRARQAGAAPSSPPPPPAAERLPFVVVGHHVLRQARRRGAGRRLRLAVRQRGRDGGGGLPALLPLRAHLPERPAVPALRVARAAAPGPRAQEEAPDRPQRRLPRHIAALAGRTYYVAKG